MLLSFMAILSFMLLFSSAVSAADPVYVLQDDYTIANFFDMFTFFTGSDPTNGHVQYVNRNTATTNGYIATNPSSIYVGVDHAGFYPRFGPGRPSVRLISNKIYTHGLFILDLSHMPTGCGTWPAFWTLGPNWPNNGEIDIIEGVNLDVDNHMTLHSSQGCTIAGSGMTGHLDRNDCAFYPPNYNPGCGISAPVNSNSYGSPFNLNGGGVYATEWTSAYIKVWFFPRDVVPGTIENNEANPNISLFGTPTAIFQGSCDVDQHFANHQIIFNTDFCGDYAGNTYSGSGCPLTANLSSWDSCVTFVGNNPQNFTEAYWSINSLKVYQMNGVLPLASSPASSVIPQSSSRGSGVGGGMGNTGTTASSSFVPAVSSAALSTTPSIASCPSMNMTQFVSAVGSVYLIECDINHALGNLPAPNGLHQDTFTGCINACDARLGCVDLSWVSGGGACYLKGSVGTAGHQTGTYGAKLITAGSLSVSSSPLTIPLSTSSAEPQPSSATAPSSMPSSQTILLSSSTASSFTPQQSQTTSVAPVCPAGNQTVYTNANGTQWFVECGIGHAGCNISPTGLDAASLQICVDRCANRLNCVEAIYSGGKCYEKSCVGTATFNAANSGARLIGQVSNSSASQPSTTVATSRNSVASSMSTAPFMLSSSVPPTMFSLVSSSSASQALNSVAPSLTALSSAASPGSSTIACPASNQTDYITINGIFHIDCGINYSSGNMPGTGQIASSFQACVDRCAMTLGCRGVVSFNGACFLKATIGAMSVNAADNAARLLIVSVSPDTQVSIFPPSVFSLSPAHDPTVSTPSGLGGFSSPQAISSAVGQSSATTTTSASSILPSGTLIACPSSNSTIYHGPNSTNFFVECFHDTSGSTIAAPAIQTFEGCMNACANQVNCVRVSWQAEPKICYMKSSIGTGSDNTGVWGARVVQAISSVLHISSQSLTSNSTMAPPNGLDFSNTSPTTGSSVTPFNPSTPVQSVSIISTRSAPSAGLSSTIPPSPAQSSSLVVIAPSDSVNRPSVSTIAASSAPLVLTSLSQNSLPTSVHSSGTPLVQSLSVASVPPPSRSADNPSISSSSPVTSLVTLPVQGSHPIQTTRAPSISGGSPTIPVIAPSQLISVSGLSPHAISSSPPISEAFTYPSSSVRLLSSSTISANLVRTSLVSLETSTPGPNVEVKYDPGTNTTFAEFTMDSLTMTGSLLIPVNGTSTHMIQYLNFELQNSGNVFGKRAKRRHEVRQSYSGCLLTVYYGGVAVFSIDIVDLFSEYQTYTSDSIIPSQTDTAIQFVETCQNTAIFPTVQLTNVTIFYETSSEIQSSSIGLGFTSFASSSDSRSEPISVSSIFSYSVVPIPQYSLTTSGAFPSSVLYTSSYLGSVRASTPTSLTTSNQGAIIPPSMVDTSSSILTLPSYSTSGDVITRGPSLNPSTVTRGISTACPQCSPSPPALTLTHSTCAPRPRITQTIFSTATVTSCPDSLVCPSTNGNLSALTSSDRLTFQPSVVSSTLLSVPSSPGCISSLYGSLCYNCALTPTLVPTTCNSVITSLSIVSSSTISSSVSSQTPLCPYEAPGRLYAGILGGIYSIYCALDYADGILGQALYQESFVNCISACDAYNIVHFNEGSPCRGVSYYETAYSENCFLKSSVSGPVARLGVDSARLMNPQLPADNSTTSIITVTSTASVTITHDTGTGIGTGSPVTITQRLSSDLGTGPGTTIGTGPGTGLGTGAGTSLGTGVGTGLVTGPETGLRTGPGTGPGTDLGTGPGTGPGTGVGTGQGTIPTTIYSTVIQTTTFVSISTTFSISISVSTSVSTFTAVITYISTTVTTISGTATTIVSSVPVPTTIVSSVAVTESITFISSVPVTVTTVGTQFITVPPVTVTASGESGGVVTITATVSSKSSTFVCHPTPMNYLHKQKRRLLASSLHIDALEDL